MCEIAAADEMKIPLTFSGGHETDPQDHGRPVVLVAAGLGVKPEVFREAFRGVTPAHDGKPSPEQQRSNKEALMKVLKPLGVTNDRLDEVSNYYRYQPQRGELWKATPAEGHAVVENGKIKRIVVTAARFRLQLAAASNSAGDGNHNAESDAAFRQGPEEEWLGRADRDCGAGRT